MEGGGDDDDKRRIFPNENFSRARMCWFFFSSFSVITRVRMFGATSPRVHPHKHEEMFAARTRAKQCFNENVRNGGWRAFHGNLCV